MKKDIIGNNYFTHESSYVHDSVSIGDNTKIWHFCHLQEGAGPIGKNCVVGQNVYVGANVKIGDGCKIQNNVSLYDGVELEDYVFCGPSCVFTNDLTPRSKHPKGHNYRIKTLVKRGASIGANATIVCGNTIGSWAMIGAGAVVASDVPNYALMLGVPARQVGWVCVCGLRLGDDFSCTCGRLYSVAEGKNIVLKHE
jgi:UDP-2-acetamido-3-amino-2,3-dideoxy-glucuronate N-acetyltransferase